MRQGGVIVVLLTFIALELAGQRVSLIDRDELMEISGRSSDTTYVLNFWATWCSPCVREIEFFQELHDSSENKKLKVMLVSLDFPNQMESRLLPFLEKKDITAPVVLMNDLDYDAWIERVDTSWSGAIPATLIFKKDRRVFLEKELSRQELLNHVNQIMN